VVGVAQRWVAGRRCWRPSSGAACSTSLPAAAFHLAVSDAQYLLTFAVMLVVALASAAHAG